MFWIVWLISATGIPVALTLETGSAMPSATTRGASFCATLRDLGKRPFRETDCELFICKLLFNPIDTTSRRQHTKHPFKAPTTTPGRRLHWTAISLASRCTALPLPDPFRLASTVPIHFPGPRCPAYAPH